MEERMNWRWLLVSVDNNNNNNDMSILPTRRMGIQSWVASSIESITAVLPTIGYELVFAQFV